jgi:hypothetical protein
MVRKSPRLPLAPERKTYPRTPPLFATLRNPRGKIMTSQTLSRFHLAQVTLPFRPANPVAIPHPAMAKKKAAQNTATDYSKDPINAKLTPSEKVDLLRLMVRIRRFETVSLKYYQQGKMGGLPPPLHRPGIRGCRHHFPAREHDHVITAYRDHGHALAVGMGMNECMAELFGKATGCSKARAARCTTSHRTKTTGAVTASSPARPRSVLGLALRLKYRGIKGCCLCFLGDGAVNQGAYPRVAQPGRAVGSAGDLRDRKQRLLDGHQPGALQRPPRQRPRRPR